MAHKTIVIWGTGKIGRGFVADLFHTAGYHIILVDESPTLITQLREVGGYTVMRAESAEQRKDVVIEGYTALDCHNRPGGGGGIPTALGPSSPAIGARDRISPGKSP
jgi:mannitol-1-phosphate/altronate dehydrogenase